MTATIEFPSQFEQMQYRRAEIADIDQQSVLLRAVPYDVEVPIDVGLVESFEPRAFRGAVKDPARVKLFLTHDQPRVPAGVATEIIDRAEGVDIRAKFASTAGGQDLRSLLMEQIMDEASIEFRAIPKDMQVIRDGDSVHVRHRRAHLTGVAIVPEGAYGRNAVALSVRDIRARAQEKARMEALARLNAYNH
jgi:HK97 family phage prohead protease